MSKTVSLYVYKVKDPAEAENARKQAMATFQGWAGFVDWQALRRPAGADETLFADVIEWADQAALDEANARFPIDDRLAPFRAQIVEMVTGEDFRPL